MQCKYALISGHLAGDNGRERLRLYLERQGQLIANLAEGLWNCQTGEKAVRTHQGD
ncbi:hypothetical protein D3C81_2296940 [compost metagenome]